MENIIYDKFLNDSPEPLTIKSIETILEQMKNSICKIYNGKLGTGFFIKIPFHNIQLPVLITNNHIIDENDYINKKIITIYLGNEKNGKNIKLDDKRKFYTNKNYDTTIIEIKENTDGIKNFLELDDKLMECLSMNKDEIPEFLKNVYLNKSLYILNYPEGKEIVASIAQPGQIIDQYIIHKCNTKTGSSGSPILLCENQKVIGVHLGSSNTLKYNKGILIIYSIIEFNQVYKNNIYELIDLKYKLIKLLDDRFIEKNKINCELENIQYEENWSKNEFNIEKIGEEAYKLYKICKDVKNGISYDIKKYFKKEYEKYYNIDLIFDNLFNIENSGSAAEIGVSCIIDNPLSLDLSKFPLLIISSNLFGKNISIKNRKILKVFNIELNDDTIYYKDKYIIIIKLYRLKLLLLNKSLIYLDDLNDINIKEINYNQNTSLNQNEILLIFKINFSDINKKIYFVYNEKKIYMNLLLKVKKIIIIKSILLLKKKEYIK